MSRLIQIAGWSGEPRASALFVHGLGGHPYDTWRRAANNDTFWPLWLANDVEGIKVYTVAYEAPPTNWLGTSMPLQDRAVNILEYFLSESALKAGPIVFVCHSLGGLIVKQILLDLQQRANSRPEAADFLSRARQVVFAATPHTGSRRASWLDYSRFLAWPSTIARVLVANDPALRSINFAYRLLAEDRKNVLQHRIFYETQDTAAGRIVDEASSDPGLPGVPPVPIDADHISIVRPADRSSLIYALTRDFVAKNPSSAKLAGGLTILPLPPIESEHSRNIIPKLVRVALIALAGLIAYKGVQALIAPGGPSKEQIEQIQKPLAEQLSTKDAQIAALTKLLLERNPDAGPNAQQAVGEAVGSIAKGAAEGDARLQQALDLLKANKVADAAQLLRTFAEDKTAQAERATAQAEKDRKDAAIAYRNLGAIAGLRDPKQALEAYEKALALDPDGLESLFWAGWIRIEHGDLNEAWPRIERALTLATNQDQIFYQYWALIGLGYIKIKRGDLAGALKSYGDGLAIADRLAKSDPSNAGWQGYRSVSNQTIGDVQVAQGNLTGALKSYRDGLAIDDRPAKSDPGNAGWQRDLSASYEKVGDVLVAQGDLKGALASYRDSLTISDRLARADPGSAEWQRNLSLAHERVGDVELQQGDFAGALKSYRDDVAIVDRLAKFDPGNAEWQRDLSVSNERIGDVLVLQGDLATALNKYRDSLVIADRLAKSDSGNASWQRDLVVAYNKVGDVQLAQGDLAGALVSYQAGLAIIDSLAKSDPGNAGWQRDLFASHIKTGNVQVAQGDLAGALKSYCDGLAIIDPLAKSDPGNAGWQRDLSVSYAKLASGYRASNDMEKARWALTSGRAIIAKLVEQQPDWAQGKQQLAWFDAQIAELGEGSAKETPKP
jgi:tetratricopeptide (TPR) repeat protein